MIDFAFGFDMVVERYMFPVVLINLSLLWAMKDQINFLIYYKIIKSYLS